MFETNRRPGAGVVHRMDPAHVHYKRLNDGSWGLRGPSERLNPGKIVQVHKRDGNTKDEVVGSIVWTGDGLAIARIVAPVTNAERLGFRRFAGRGFPRTVRG